MNAAARRVLLALLPLAAPALAQEQVFAKAAGDRQVCLVRVVPYPGAAPVGGLGFAVVHAENLDDRPHVVEVGYSSREWDDCAVAASRTVALGPRERARFALPLPNTGGNHHGLSVTFDGDVTWGELPASTTDGLVGLLVAERPDARPWSVVVLQAMRSRSTTAPAAHSIAPEDVPADWRLFTGFDAVLVDGRARLGAEVQEALRRFAFAGGTVVLGAADRLPAGALRDLCSPLGDGGVMPHGLGRCIAVAIGGDTTALRSLLGAVPAPGTSGWPAPDAMLALQPVPGLGEAPVLVFLFVILLFAFVVGPLNFLLLRRWRRPLLVLATVPVCGLGTTLVMFVYGFLHDGLGVRGVVRSWTLLDQQRHEAVSFAARTLFAGLSPDALAVAADGLVIAPWAFTHQGRRAPDRWQWSAEDNALDGGVLPSRRATPLLSVQQGLVRERLRARIDGDRMELLAEGGVAPEGEIVLRDADGGWWVGVAPVLQRAGGEAGRVALARWRRSAGTFPARGRDGDPAALSVHGLVEQLLAGGDLTPGGYVARVARATWLDEHVLAVDYDAASHFVVGRLAPEDVVR